MDGVGEALVFSMKTSHQLKTRGLVYRPAPEALTKVKINVGAKVNMWRDPTKGSKKGSQRNN